MFTDIVLITLLSANIALACVFKVIWTPLKNWCGTCFVLFLILPANILFYKQGQTFFCKSNVA